MSEQWLLADRYSTIRPADGELQFWTAFAVKEAAIYQLQMQQQHLQAEIDEIDEGLRQTAKRRKLRMAAIMRLCSLRRQDTNKRRAIPLDKRVAIGLYRLASSAEERTVAHLFGVSRPSANLIFREFCRVVVQRFDHLYIRFLRPCEMADHLRQLEAVLGFSQGVVNASDYYNYRGWYSIILFAVADHNYEFLPTNVGSPGKNHDSNVFRRSKLPATPHETVCAPWSSWISLTDIPL
ncbi:hypothetical protein HPB48_013501 [Haemaphysalis longicornis]|uniref:DDE Tnp4 domain-containing protein n=1 Tax=Haemaphysalis longicornis TaxID=44386 RepID=A0A9J6FM41_HAELO|nr:hypothetical protein HPB48_013501 [Haemaphysalis longicornis]